MKKKPLIYIAGPITIGGEITNTRNALHIAESLIKKGFIPFVPHLSMVWQLFNRHDLDWWIAYDKQILLRCDALLRLPGESIGADKEVEFAENNNILAFFSVADLINYYKEKKNLMTFFDKIKMKVENSK